MKPMTGRVRAIMIASLAAAALFAATAPALAAGSNIPWEQPLNQIFRWRGL
jgi:type IV secretory pathway VirB2 component (pilin)